MLKETNIQYLVGGEKVLASPLVPYDQLICDFFNDLSLELRSSQEAAQYPDIMSLAFWCRKANISRLKSDHEDGRARLGLGLALHITPNNVPVNFAFSFAFGLLAGNANIVKVPRKPYRQIELICQAINNLFQNSKYQKIKDMTAFINYPDLNEITSVLSSNCQARIIWGGDATVKNIRQMPIPIRGVEIAFSDRYSFCVMNPAELVGLSAEALKKLADNFYNDTYLMDQNACASPHLIVWLGENLPEEQEKFWSAVYRTAAKKYPLAAVNAVDKYTLLCHNAIELEGIQRFARHGNLVYRLLMNDLPEKVDLLRGKYGYFYEFNTSDLNRLAYMVNTKYQTLTYFGMDKSKLLEFVVKNRLSGIDRIVPIGQALNIDVIWDGYDVVKSLSRIINV